MNILILGSARDGHAAHVKKALEEAGAIVDYWDTRLFPTQVKLSWQPDTRVGSLKLSDDRSLKFQEIHSIFWRNFSGVHVPNLKDAEAQNIALNDAMSTLRSLIQACPARWVNSWQAYQFHKEKPLQLAMAQSLGVKIPATLISNDPQQIMDFAIAHEKVIFKPVCGGAHTQFLTLDYLEPSRLKLALSIAPITLQEYIWGTNVRSYVLANSVYTAEIRSSSVDFREDLDAQLIPFLLPDFIQQQCVAIAQAFSLKWTAIDWRVKPNGEYVFLEANPSPMFIHFEQKTGFPITEKLVQLLMATDQTSLAQ
ncbi:MAG: hypothetical protein HC780_24205 [Leptolyngbyaceae cyanobacterium CSU_1_3]|nr:hypothetical protein [Leptolyngbyaceae cyanobacterium CSU_1_3]